MKVLEQVGQISLYGLLEREADVSVSRAKEVFEPVLIRKEESDYLQTKEGKPAF